MRITVKQLKELIREAVEETMNLDDYFSSDRESGREARDEVTLEDIMKKLHKGEPLDHDELETLEDHLHGTRELAGLKGSEVFHKKDKRGF